MTMLIFNLLLSQSQVNIPVDSLSSMEYTDLRENIKKEKDSSKQMLYLAAYLHKAKKNEDYHKTVTGYKNFIHYSAAKFRLAYADSMIRTAKKSLDTSLLASTYLTKGIVFYGTKNYQAALDYYLMADGLATTAEVPDYLLFKIKYSIGQIKYYLKEYDQALVLLEACSKFYKDAHLRPYLNTLHSMSLCHSGLSNYATSNQLIQLGLEMGATMGNRSMEPYFIHSKGINAYHLKSYHRAIKLLNNVLPKINGDKDFANIILGKFYIGMSLWELNRLDEAIVYFKAIDQAFEQRNYIKPEFQKAYKLLVKYYTENNTDIEHQLYYSNRLIKVDSVIHTRYKNLSSTVHSDYNLAKLQSENMALLNKSKSLKKYGILWKTIVGLLFVFIVWWVFNKTRIYAKRDKDIKRDNEQDLKDGEDKAEEHNTEEDSRLYVPLGAKKAISKQLKEFENKKDYLQPDINLYKLAISFDVNSKYLSRVIRNSKKKRFSAYINELKIQALKDMLKNEKETRKYTNKALAQLIGYGSVPRLTRTFKLHTNTTISGYVKKLEKREEKQY